MDQKKAKGFQIGKKAFLTSIFILAGLILVSGILTKVLPSGEYAVLESQGREIVQPGTYTEISKPDYPVWRWITAPVEVFWGSNSLTIIVLVAFLIFIGGSFALLEESGMIDSMLYMAARRFRNQRYILMAVIMFTFMFFGAVLGIFEAMIPLVVFVVPLALALGWDSITGLGMSLLALAFGFSAGITNPFTIAVAQSLADLPVFSGSWLRIIFFAITYILTFMFVRRYGKKIDRNPQNSLVYKEDAPLREIYKAETFLADRAPAGKEQSKALRFVIACLGTSVLFIVAAALVPAIPTDAAFPLVAILFATGGIGAGFLTGMKSRSVFSTFGRGVMSIIPGVLLVLLAMSVPHIISQGKIMGTILHSFEGLIQGTSVYTAAILVLGVTLILNFFIGSASAKAFLVMPIIVPLADLTGLTRQTTILAFGFGDGFTNMLYPTNPVLIIALGLTVVSYTKWLKWTLKIQLPILAISILFLLFAVKIGYGPF